MNQVLRKGARKGSKTTMMNVETNDTAAAVAEQGATVAPQKAALKKAASRKKGAPQGQKRAKGTPPNKPAKKAQKSARQQARTIGKGAKILELIGRAKGATLAEIRSATGWQAHSVRGFISTAGNKHGIQIESARNEAGGRFYRIAQ